jgi:hypothetical protein
MAAILVCQHNDSHMNTGLEVTPESAYLFIKQPTLQTMGNVKTNVGKINQGATEL